MTIKEFEVFYKFSGVSYRPNVGKNLLQKNTANESDCICISLASS